MTPRPSKRAPKPRDVKPENMPCFNRAADVLLEAEIALSHIAAEKARRDAMQASIRVQAALRNAWTLPRVGGPGLRDRTGHGLAAVGGVVMLTIGSLFSGIGGLHA